MLTEAMVTDNTFQDKPNRAGFITIFYRKADGRNLHIDK